MKRLILFLAFLFAIISYSEAQPFRDILSGANDTTYAIGDYTTVYSPLLEEYWDYSVQLKFTFYGVGDSAYFTQKTYQTNDPEQSNWTELTTLRDTFITTTTNTGFLIEKTDFPGVWLKHVVTSVGEDTVIIKPYFVKKMKRYY